MGQVLKKAAELGFLDLPMDPKYGGTGADDMTIMAMFEELAAVNGGVVCVIGDSWFAQTRLSWRRTRTRESAFSPLSVARGSKHRMDLHDRAAGQGRILKARGCASEQQKPW